MGGRANMIFLIYAVVNIDAIPVGEPFQYQTNDSRVNGITYYANPPQIPSILMSRKMSEKLKP